MDDNKRIRISLIIVNIVLVLSPIMIWYYRDFFGNWVYWQTRDMYLTYLGWVAGLFTFANFLVLLYIRGENYEIDLLIEKQKKEEETKRQIAERELQMERERQIQRERKRELLKNYEAAGRYEAAARLCDELEMWEKAGELRRMGKTSYLISTNFSMGKEGAISCTCPNCGSSQAVASKTNMVKCEHCGNSYIIPKKILDMM
jgi:ribosomal protein S27E